MKAIDTNIWIYCQDNRDNDKQRIALDLVAETRPLALPWQVGCEFLAACRKLAGSGFSQEQSWQRLKEMQAMADIILIPSAKHWTICQSLLLSHKVSFWDGMLLASCIDGGVKVLYTEDLTNNSLIEGVQIVNPFSQ